MAFSRENFIQTYIDESQEYINAFTDEIIRLKDNPGSQDIVTEILRNLHTLKGSSRMMDFTSIETLVHGLEDIFKGVRENVFEFTDRLLQLSFVTTDQIKKLLEKIKTSSTDEENIKPFTDALNRASKGLFFDIENLNAISKNSYTTFADYETADENTDIENLTSVRIPIARINSIIRSFDDLLIRQFRFKHQLEHFEQKLSDAGNGILPKQLKEDLLLTENSIFETQHALLNLRMLPLSIILEPLKLSFETEAARASKNIIFDIPQTNFSMDKIILEKLKEILLHLMRNSLDHGIETEKERIAAGKSPNGKIYIYTTQISNHIIITVGDDGKGIQYKSIKEKALLLYPQQKNEINAMSEKQLQQYLFLPGFTTKDSSTEMSGRGMGLDIVRSNMERIKGKIQIFSEENKGTQFKLTIPLSLATQQGLFVQSGSMKFMIPSHYIHEIADGENLNFIISQGQNYVCVHNQFIPIYHLSSLLGTEKSKTDNAIIVLEYLDTQIAVAVRSIEQYENVVVTALPQIMRNMNSLQGVVYDENYSIIPILNIPNIMQRMKGLLAYDMKKFNVRNKKKTQTILIADDSSTTRQIEQTIFETDGFTVKTAGDGIEALEIMKTYNIDIFIIDINMPRMDGNTLLNNIRRSAEYHSTPVVVVSGAYDKQAEENFIQAGAQAFIVKSQFERGMLLRTVKELLGEN
ncbi:response regulator [Treponema rectale]|uniref:histidine kinase n=1 Tax=Treponema rectale TaxID=744512 RepID=A0A840SDK4_9SPIR|nr:response regulator [Treponema rectale]MBB5218016.1 two-component system chemotaxis sensor kinase CheA [Treponema rectale]QOS40269.1 response regulator [Treponema rectale]